ncbi:branched-chain amino acid ABC transporter permease [Heyndrickxia oleronia]|uniref:Branched-chain amino acid ABC transporter permease n=1 Tax=Heyndrickxia oleronia TaxID=38875 RepID=A0AAW6STG5_9BACI|nr:branched-chain amino acid ABC transporter permease [Heyndrickxia oleronia]MDH5161585.1 branched-chain amino acid ABC transporter permease [Heyndrickxia oleronia]
MGNLLHYIKWIILVAVIIILPFISNSFFLSMMILIGLYALVGTGLTMLMGYAGQISLGHAAFYGIGAYSTAIMTGTYGLPSVIGIIVGLIIAGIIAYIIGHPTLKLKENYLALATLGFGIIIFTFFKEFKGLTGGLNGFFGIPAFNLFGFLFDTDLKFYLLTWILVLLGIIFANNIIQSRVGRALRSIHGSEVAASSIGINIQKYKLQVFVLSAIYASIAGSLYAHYITFINPNLFTAMESINFLIIVVIGGSASVWGGVIGAALYVFLSEWLKEITPTIFPNVGGEFQIIFFGLLIVVMLIFMPKGFISLLKRLGDKISFLFKGRNKAIENQTGGE